MKNKHLFFLKYPMFSALLWCMCCGICAHAQDPPLRGKDICEGETVKFDDLLGGSVFDGTLDGWYVNNQKVSGDLYGFSAAPDVTTTYELRFIKDGVAHAYSSLITVYKAPDLVIPPDRDVCSGEGVDLKATVTNSTPYTQIQWQYNGGTHDNGSTIYPHSIGVNTLTAIARNAPQCPSVTKAWHVTAIFNPTTAYSESSAATHCSRSTINLNDRIIFFVSGSAGRDTAKTTSGTILWYSDPSYSTPVPDPEHVTLSLKDTMFYANLSGVTVSYSNTCDGNLFQHTLTGNRQAVSINVNSDNFVFDYGYNNMCPDDSVKLNLRLLNEANSPSKCDVIGTVTTLNPHAPDWKVDTSLTEQMLVFAPFTDLTDTIKIKATSTHGVEKEIKLFLRQPYSVSISTETACINTPGHFTVTIDPCDTIEKIVCSITGTTTDEKLATNRWRMRTPDRPDDTPFDCTVTYYSKLYDKSITETAGSTLTVWKDPPVSSISLMLGNSYSRFDSNSQNLCLGDSLLFTFSAPHFCDTITDVQFTNAAKQSAGTLSYQDKHNHLFIIKPTAEGAYSYTALVHYKRPKETLIRDESITYTVQVKQRPRMLVDNPAITPRCYSEIPDDPQKDPPLDLDDPDSPAYSVIDYTFVEPGTAKFYDTYTSTFTPTETGKYGIMADYRYMCSEMTSKQAFESVHVIVSNKNEDGSVYILQPPAEGFCIRDGITIEKTEKPGSELTWKYNGDIIPPFPYRPAAGTYDLLMNVKNACYPDDPYTHTVTVTVVPLPEVKAVPNATEWCRGDRVTLEVERYVGERLTWTQSPSGNPVSNPVTINETTTFTAHASNAACGVEATDKVTLFRMPDAAVQVMPDTSVCKYDEIPLRVTHKVGDISWSGGPRSQSLQGESPTIAVTADETYVATASNRCTQATDAVTVRMLEIPSIKMKYSDTTICYGETLNFSACIASSTGDRLQWEPDNNTNLTEPVKYVITASTEKCGEKKDSLYLSVYKPLALLPTDSHLPGYNKQDWYDLRFQTLQGEPELTYSLEGTLPPGLALINDRLYGKPRLGPLDYNTHRFEVSVTDGHRCKLSRTYTLVPEWKAANVLLPVSDTPDNTTFLSDYELEIYNRNGLLMHKGMGWNGRWNDVHVPAGTYFYKAKITIDSKPGECMGFVVIMY